jgi:hypothetical protein
MTTAGRLWKKKIRESIKLQKTYIRAYDGEIRRWNALKTRWTSQVETWSHRRPHDDDEVKEFTDQRLAIHAIVEEHTAWIGQHKERLTVTIDQLSMLQKADSASRSALIGRVQSSITINIEERIPEMRVIAEKMERAVSNLEVIAQKHR